METSRPLLDAAGQSITMTLPAADLRAADRTRLAQVFGNLLNNSSSSAIAGNPIAIAIVHEDGQAVVRIATPAWAFRAMP